MKPSVTDHNARHAIIHVSPPARKSPNGLCYFFLTELSPSEKKKHKTKSGSESPEVKKGSRCMSSWSGRVAFLKLSVYIVIFHNKIKLHLYPSLQAMLLRNQHLACQHRQFLMSISNPCHDSFCKRSCIEQTFIIRLGITEFKKTQLFPLSLFSCPQKACIWFLKAKLGPLTTITSDFSKIASLPMISLCRAT